MDSQKKISDTHSSPSQPLSKEKTYENFLISTNTEYRSQISALREELNDLQHEKDELEADNGKIEQSQQYMRGILKNYYYIDEYNTNIKKSIDGLLTSSQTSAFVLKIGTITAILATLVAILSSRTQHWNWLTTTAILIIIALTYIGVYDHFVALPSRNTKLTLKKIQAEIDTIKKTNALLPDLFDNL